MAAITCALAPAYTVRWHLGGLPTTLLESFILLTLLAFAVETLRQNSRIAWRTPFTVPAVLFLVAGALAVVAAPATDRVASLGLYRAYLVEPMAFFLVLSSVVTSLRRASVILAGLAAGAVVVGVANGTVVLQALAHHTLDLAGTPPVVIYQTANAVALYLLPLIAIGASLVVYGRSPERQVSAGFLLIAVPAFLLSFSRGGYLALAAVVLALALTHRYRLWLVAGAALVGAILTRVPPIAARIGHELNFADPSNTLVGRIPLWQATLQVLAHNPLFGAGLSGFTDSIAPYWNPTHTDRFIYPHNIVLNFWVSTGLLGLIAFAWILVRAFQVSWRGWRSGDRAWAPIHLGVFLALVGIVVHGLFDVPYFKNDLSLEFWVLLGLSYAGVRWAGFRATAMVSGLPK